MPEAMRAGNGLHKSRFRPSQEKICGRFAAQMDAGGVLRLQLNQSILPHIEHGGDKLMRKIILAVFALALSAAFLTGLRVEDSSRDR